MRQENYLIALFDRKLLDLRVPLPRILQGGEQAQTLTRALEWNLRACLLGHLFDQRGVVRGVFLKEKHRKALAAELKRRMIFFGVVNAVFAPLIVGYLLMHSFFRYFEVRLDFFVQSCYLLGDVGVGISQEPILNRKSAVHTICEMDVSRVQRVAAYLREALGQFLPGR